MYVFVFEFEGETFQSVEVVAYSNVAVAAVAREMIDILKASPVQLMRRQTTYHDSIHSHI